MEFTKSHYYHLGPICDFSQIEETVQHFEWLLAENGLHGALEFLNDRTPHRFTGLYVMVAGRLRNVALYDSFDVRVQRGEKAAGELTRFFRIDNPVRAGRPSPGRAQRWSLSSTRNIRSYCGVPLRDGSGAAFGTLCHFDMHRCQERKSDLPLLRQAAEILKGKLAEAGGAPLRH